MKILINRPFTEYSKDIATHCEQFAEELNVKASVFYTGFLDALNNRVYQEMFRNDPNPVIMIVVNDFIFTKHHNVNMAAIASIPKQFVIITEVYNAQLNFPSYPNVHYVNMGPTLLANHTPWERIKPQNHKNLVEGPHWISLSNNARPQRTLTACILANHNLGLKPHDLGLLRINIDGHGGNKPINDFEEWKGWLLLHSDQAIQFSHVQENKLKRGYSKLEQKLQDLPENAVSLPGFPKSLDVYSNFDIALRPLYKSAVLEIVNETLFFEQGVCLSEKYFNTIMGFAFPLIIGNAGSVSYLRSLGIDMFDDVINHEYDEQTDNVYRAFVAIEDNLHLLANPEVAREHWIRCYSRFQKNYDFVKHELKHRCRSTLDAELLQLLPNL